VSITEKHPTLKLTNLHMLKTGLLPSNPCCRNQQTSVSLQIRQSQTFSLTIDYQLIITEKIKNGIYLSSFYHPKA